jgi:hypothetical protein
MVKYPTGMGIRPIMDFVFPRYCVMAPMLWAKMKNSWALKCNPIATFFYQPLSFHWLRWGQFDVTRILPFDNLSPNGKISNEYGD